MNLFVKKILAKYVKYIEIIGYVFVLLFIGGLVALSFIKAEDEFVHLNGQYEIAVFVPELAEPHWLVATFADSFATVAPGAPLLEITEDAAYCIEQAILSDLQNQATVARANSRPELARQLESVIQQHTPLSPPTSTRKITAQIPGEFLRLDATSIGGVFDFAQSTLRVTEFPPDGRQKKKLQVNQTGTATLAGNLALPVKLVELSENEAVFKIDSLKISDKIQLAVALTKVESGAKIPTSLAVLVGWRSWMQLIWR